MKLIFKRGFTLIELLVVIAIIGILASVVLASVNRARDRGANAAVKSNLNGIRSQADIVYDNNGQSYADVCADSNVVNAMNAAFLAGGDAGSVPTRCNDALEGWAANALLKAPEGADVYWCVDSAGVGKGTASELAGATACS